MSISLSDLYAGAIVTSMCYPGGRFRVQAPLPTDEQGTLVLTHLSTNESVTEFVSCLTSVEQPDEKSVEQPVTFSQDEVDQKVREALDDYRREIGQAIWQAKIDNGLCSEVERFMEQHDMGDCIPLKIKVEVYINTTPVPGEQEWRTASRVQSEIQQALDAAGIVPHDMDSEVVSDY